MIDTDAKDLDFPRGFEDERGQDSDDGRFPCAVGSKQGKEVAFFYVQIYTFKCLDLVSVGFREISGFKSVGHTLLRKVVKLK